MKIDFATMPPEGSPFAELERIRAKGPIFWCASLHGWVVSAYDDVKKVQSDSANFSNENTPLAQAFGAEAMLVTDTPLHHKMRGVWAKPTSVAGSELLTEDMERIAASLVQPLADRLNAGEAVNLTPIFESFVGTMTTLLMDIPIERKDDLLAWNRAISDLAVLPLEESDPRFGQRREAKDGVFALLRSTVQDRRERLAKGEELTDLISLMVAAEGRDGITESIALDNLLNLVLGALDTTVRWFGNVIAVLSRHPEAMAEIRADRSLLPKAMEEVMRMESVVQLSLRIARNDDVTLCGQPLKAGDFVYGLPGAANRDPQLFERADEFDLARKPKLHLGFGFGMHQCLGMNVARKEVLTFVNMLLDQVPSFDVTECDYGPSWSLWGPLKLVVRAS